MPATEKELGRTLALLEPAVAEAHIVYAGPSEALALAIQLSIAISLRRIADKFSPNSTWGIPVELHP